MEKKKIFINANLIILLLLNACTNSTKNTYYVDQVQGNNANSGTKPGKARKTLEPVNALMLLPGDKVLLKAGCQFAGALTPQGSGIEGMPIVIDRYGEGSKPVVAGKGKIQNTLRLHNQHHWEISNLKLTNTDGGGWDDKGRTLRRAIYITAEDTGDVAHIYLKNLEISDVRGMYRFDGHETNSGIISRKAGAQSIRMTLPGQQLEKLTLQKTIITLGRQKPSKDLLSISKCLLKNEKDIK
jgi:hypothetical protein